MKKRNFGTRYVSVLLAAGLMLLLLNACTATGPVAPFHGTVARQDLFLPGGHHKPINQLEFSSSGRYCATVSYDRSVKVWDTHNRKVLANLHGHERGIMGVAFSPDDQWVASSDMDGLVRVWDWKSGKAITTIEASRRCVGRLVFLPDGRSLAGASDDGYIRIWSLPDGGLVNEISAHNKSILGLALDPDSRTLYTAGFDRQVKAWHINDLSLLHTWKVPGGVTWLTLSPDHTRLGASLLNKKAVVLDTVTGEIKLTLTGHSKPVSGIVFFNDSVRTATTCLDGSLRLFDGNGEQTAQLTPDKDGNMTTLGFNPLNPDELWSGGWFNNLWIWDIKKSSLVETITASFSPVFSLDISRDGRFLAVGSQNTGVAVWKITKDPGTGAPIYSRHAFQSQTLPCLSLALHPKLPHLAYTDTEGFIHVLNLKDNTFIHHTLLEDLIPSKTIKRLEIDPSGNVLAASNDSRVIMLRLTDMAFLRQCDGRDKNQKNFLGAILFHPSEPQLITASGNILTAFQSSEKPGHCQSLEIMKTQLSDSVLAMAVSPNQRFLALLGKGGALHVQSFGMTEKETRPLFSWQMTDEHGKPVRAKSVAFSKDGHHLIAGAANGEIQVFHLLESDPIHRIHAHTGGVNDLVVSPDGGFIYSGGEDSVVRVWSWPNMALHTTLAAGPDGFRCLENR